jgi:peptide/nickel transport system substrate-binding protein
MLAAGASLLVAASLASAAGNAHALKKGGIWRYGIPSASTAIDTQVGYVTTSWFMEYATAAKLYNYPDKAGAPGTKLVPEVASNFKVSNNGKTYTFTIRKGFKFSDGTAVTAKNFKYAINRVANKQLSSPGAQFITDPNGTNIVGAQAVNAGHGTSVSGAVVKGNKLTIHLTKADGTFMAKITMPFFQATSTKVPLTKEITSLGSMKTMPSAGPYAFARNIPNQLTQLRRNPFYKSGPGRHRPHNLTGFDIQWNTNEQTGYTQTLANQLDEVQPPAAELAGTGKRFGVNKSRFWVKPVSCTGYLPMNTARPLFKSLALRKAVNYAVSRRDYLTQAGAYAGQPWSHILNPTVPGNASGQPYPLGKPNLSLAHKLVKASTLKSKKINVFYRSNSGANIAQSQIVRRDLIRLGFSAGNIEMKQQPGADIYDAMGKRGTPADIGVSMGWCSDFPDPYDWLNILLYGPGIQAENNNNYSYFNNAKWNRKLAAAARLVGPKRLKVYGQLDQQISKQAAPVAAERTYNNRYLFSNKVNPKSLVYQGIYQDWDIAAMAFK